MATPRHSGLALPSFITVLLGSRTDPNLLSDAQVSTSSPGYLLALQGPSQPVS